MRFEMVKSLAFYSVHIYGLVLISHYIESIQNYHLLNHSIGVQVFAWLPMWEGLNRVNRRWNISVNFLPSTAKKAD